MVVLIIWLIGRLFTVGFIMEQTKTLDEIGASILLFFVWPLILGCELRDRK